MKILRYIYWLFSSTGATFDDAMNYCQEQHHYYLNK